MRARAHDHGATRRRGTILPDISSTSPLIERDRELSLFGDLLEIAQALYVTPKTVEVHLSNAYRKLSIRSRQQLAAALGLRGNTGRSGRRSDGAPLRRPSIPTRHAGRPHVSAHGR